MIKPKEFLVVDTETTSQYMELAEIKVFGGYDPYEDKHYIYKWTEQNIKKVKTLLKEYKTIITFNGIKYDIPILARYGINTKFRHIDVYNIIKYRRSTLIRPEGFESYSLKALILQLGLDNVGKGEIDYNIFKKIAWTILEQDQIVAYLKQDLLLTWKLWAHLMDKFQIFESFVSEKDRERYKHIITPINLLVYKILCHGGRVQELYDERPKVRKFPQQIMTTPRREEVHNAVLLKFSYLYMHTIMQYNLASSECECCKPFSNEGKYHGKSFYTVKGYYCQKSHGRIEKFLKQLYKDSNEKPGYSVVADLVFSRLYEVFTTPLFYAIYDKNAAYDMYNLTKQELKIISRKFEDAGFLVVYIDMDKVFVQIPEGEDMVSLTRVKDSVLEYLKSKMPYPSETFDLLLCNEVSYLKFFKNPNPKDPFLAKGKYVYITNNGLIYSEGVDNGIVQQIVGVV